MRKTRLRDKKRIEGVRFSVRSDFWISWGEEIKVIVLFL
jgi:hypothetical protein